ncbi:hypothetical protein [Streptomyces iranensis]|uniref:Phage-related protein n=1 Tax=Streptomyces iranensis TaxID=576784 RepID=A0A061A9S8_9ACTN|nr:hypothetical protein [Streptomyces iranensis]MBP2060587.1 phage-related protein [Streptomyces iranensis]CDR16813.1 predicted protein [Streptomyces iranensis]
MSLAQALNRSVSGFRGLRSTVGQTDTSVSRFARTATQAGSAVGRIKGDVDKSANSMRTLQREANAAERSVAKSGRSMTTAGRGAATGGGLMGRMRTGLQGVTTAQKGLNTAMKSNVFGAVMALLMPLIMKLVDMAMQSKTVQRIVQAAFRIIGQVIGSTMRVAKQVVQTTWNGIKTAFTVVLKVIWTVVKTYFNIYKTIITTVIHAIMAVVRPLLSFFSERIPGAFRSARNGIQRAFNGLAGIVRGAFSAVLGAVRGPLNGVIGLVNRAIGALNRVKVSVPSWVPGIGGRSFGVNIPTIPTLAQGGIVLPRPGGTLALLAEGGQAEAVLPLNRLSTLLARTGPAPAPAGSGRPGGGFVIEHYHEAPGGSARQTAEDLMFLMKARG